MRFAVCFYGIIRRIENTIDGVDGKIKNLRKILIKLEVIDDRFIF